MTLRDAILRCTVCVCAVVVCCVARSLAETIYFCLLFLFLSPMDGDCFVSERMILCLRLEWMDVLDRLWLPTAPPSVGDISVVFFLLRR